MFERLSGPFFTPTTQELTKAMAVTSCQSSMIKGSTDACERRRKANQNMRLFDQLIQLEEHKAEPPGKSLLG